MAIYLVLQPNGKYAQWSTIVDSFDFIDATVEEVLHMWLNPINHPGTSNDAVERNLSQQLENINESGVAIHWAKDWDKCIEILETHDAENVLSEIDRLGIPRRLSKSDKESK